MCTSVDISNDKNALLVVASLIHVYFGIHVHISLRYRRYFLIFEQCYSIIYMQLIVSYMHSPGTSQYALLVLQPTAHTARNYTLIDDLKQSPTYVSHSWLMDLYSHPNILYLQCHYRYSDQLNYRGVHTFLCSHCHSSV